MNFALGLWSAQINKPRRRYFTSQEESETLEPLDFGESEPLNLYLEPEDRSLFISVPFDGYTEVTREPRE